MDRERYYRGNGVVETSTGLHQIAKGEVDDTKLVVSYNPKSELGRTFSVHITSASDRIQTFREQLGSSITKDCAFLGGVEATCYQFLADDLHKSANSNDEALSNALTEVVEGLFGQPE